MSPAGINTLLVSCPALASSSASSGAATQQRLAMTRPSDGADTVDTVSTDTEISRYAAHTAWSSSHDLPCGPGSELLLENIIVSWS